MNRLFSSNNVIIALFLLALILTGCKKDKDKKDIPADPKGTVETIITYNEAILFEGERSSWRLQWKSPNNFYLSKMSPDFDDHVSICDLGKVSGLSTIDYIPLRNYFTIPKTVNDSITCNAGHGYVFKLEGRFYWRTYHVRLYVEEPVISHSGTTIGAKIKYQFPFLPGEEEE